MSAMWPPRAGVALGTLMVFLSCQRIYALDERATHLLELTIAYGDNHFDPLTNLVASPTAVPDVSEYSMPYVIALLEKNLQLSRARAVLAAILGQQDTTPGSTTRGLFRDHPRPGSAYSRRSLYLVAPLLARALRKHGEKLGPELSGRVKEALELGVKALARPEPNARDDEELLRQAALAQSAAALGDTALIARSTAAVSHWLRAVESAGRTWTPSPSGDTLRLLALQRIWEATPETTRGPINQALGLCYWDFAQRVVLNLGMVAGAATPSLPEEYLEAQGIARYLVYRDFGGPLPKYVRPMATAIAAVDYRVDPAITAFVRSARQRGPYTVQTNSLAEPHPSQTTTFIHPSYSLGTMTGWSMPDSAPVFITFTREEVRPTAFVFVHGAPAHVSAFQHGNLALCSFNFDRIGVGKRLQAWVRANLGGIEQVEEVYAYGERWNGEPIAIGQRATVAIRRAGTYVAITALECGPTEQGSGLRRKPGVLEWMNPGENAVLTLTLYARQEEYALRRPVDDLRAAFIIQLWDGDQFPTTADLVRWLEDLETRPKITQTFGPVVQRTPEPVEQHPILDKGRPQPKRRYQTRTQKVHTIGYAYQKGRGNHFQLVEDLRYEQVLSRLLNGQNADVPLRWYGPAFNWAPDQMLEVALGAAAKPPSPEPTSQ